MTNISTLNLMWSNLLMYYTFWNPGESRPLGTRRWKDKLKINIKTVIMLFKVSSNGGSVIFTLLGPNIHLGTLFWDTISVFLLTGRVSHYKARAEIVLYILAFDSVRQEKTSGPNRNIENDCFLSCCAV